MSLTKGRNAFLVCTHIDKAHIHSHVIINSVNLDCTKKFRNFKNSSFAIRKISDQLCLQHGLSVIENPKQRKGHYGSWQQSQAERKPSAKINLLIDIQQKIQEGKGVGYEYFAKVFNLKEAAKTFNFLQENNLTEYAKLDEKTREATKSFNDLCGQIKQKESRLTEITELQRNISNYVRTKDIYAQYKKSGWSKKFRAQYESDITIHKAAKQFFDGLGYGKEKKLPTINMLKQEYATLFSEKKSCIRSTRRAGRV